MSESISYVPLCCCTSKILVPVGNMVISRSNYDIPFTSGMIAAILNFCGRGLKVMRYLRLQKRCACDSLPIGECEPHEKFQSVPEIQGECSICHPCRLRNQKTSRHRRVKIPSHSQTTKSDLYLVYGPQRCSSMERTRRYYSTFVLC